MPMQRLKDPFARSEIESRLPLAAHGVADASEELRRVYLIELQEAYWMEQHIATAVAGLALAMTGHNRMALQACGAEASIQAGRLKVICARHGRNAPQHRDETMQEIIAAARKWPALTDDPHVREAGALASFRRMIHYRVAVHETLASWAGESGLSDDVLLLAPVLATAKRWRDAAARLRAGVSPETRGRVRSGPLELLTTPATGWRTTA